MRAGLSVRPKCSHRCVSLKESPLNFVLSLKHATRISTEQTSMRTKWSNILRFKLFRDICPHWPAHHPTLNFCSIACRVTIWRLSSKNLPFKRPLCVSIGSRVAGCKKVWKSWKMVENVVVKLKNMRNIERNQQCCDCRDNHFWVRMFCTHIFTFFWSGFRWPFVRGVGFWEGWYLFRWHYRYGCSRVYPPRDCKQVFWMRHICVHMFLDSLGKSWILCPGTVLIQSGIVVEYLDIMFFLPCFRQVLKLKFAFHPVL